MSNENIFDGIDDKVNARKWEYEADDQLGGQVVAIFDGDGDYGPYAGYVISPAAGTTENGGKTESVSEYDPLIYYVNENSAAARDLPPGRVHVGDILVVKYFGEKEAKSGRTFKDFNHIIRPRASAVAPEAASEESGPKADW